MGKFSRSFSEFIVRNRWWVISFWVLAAAAVLIFAPKLSSVQSNDQSDFLPKEYESARALDIAKKAFPQNNAPTSTIVFENKNGGKLTDADRQAIGGIVLKLNQAKLPKTVAIVTSPQQASPDGKLQLAQVVYSGDGSAQDEDVINSTEPLRKKLSDLTKGTNLRARATGEVATSYDTTDTFDKALQIVGIGTIILILILPAFVFKSPFIGLLPVVTVALVYEIAANLLALTAHIFDFKVNQQLTILLTVVAYGVGTDYILFLLFRYRERLRSGDHSRAAVSFALSRAGEAILSAALVVASSFTALFFAKFGILSSFAPGLVILIAVMLLAALTLVPALVAILETKLFWPSKKSWQKHKDTPSVSKRLGGLIAKRPALVTVVVLVVLVSLSIGAFGYKADFTSFSQPPKSTESGSAFETLSGSFPAGTLYPTVIYLTSRAGALDQNAVNAYGQNLGKTPGVAAVMPANLSQDGKYASVSVILASDPYSDAAFDTVSGPLHDAAHATDINADVTVGGISAVFHDVETVTNRDLLVIFPIAAAFIFLILALLLRSVIAPLYLVIAVALAFAATLGANVFLFTGIGSNEGLIFIIPILLYVFVVAIGTDYNILTMTRLREETMEGNDPRKAAHLTVEHSSATVASAGLILAGSFASLLLAKVSFLTQLGLAIGIGVVLAAFVVAPILVPSVAARVGKLLWWPGHRPGKD